MITFKNKASGALCAAMLAALAGCVQMPTEKQTVVDQRPQITFHVNGQAQRVAGARVLVDELDVGAVQDYLEGQASLRVLPGTHVVKVQAGGNVLLMERAYLGDGVVRPFNITAN
ncbi:hypothetical protein [Massilia sp. 9096]|uniref:hypothetical protein n=1 Tax=Massilia sp. 9096 TaxID=1500894 RepID=UPI0006899CAD|nr:hypothetical protein [Massilia sp. 9096]